MAAVVADQRAVTRFSNRSLWHADILFSSRQILGTRTG